MDINNKPVDSVYLIVKYKNKLSYNRPVNKFNQQSPIYSDSNGVLLFYHWKPGIDYARIIFFKSKKGKYFFGGYLSKNPNKWKLCYYRNNIKIHQESFMKLTSTGKEYRFLNKDLLSKTLLDKQFKEKLFWEQRQIVNIAEKTIKIKKIKTKKKNKPLMWPPKGKRHYSF